MIRITRTDSDNIEFRKLVAALDEVLRLLDGDEHAFYSQLNKIDKIKEVVVAYDAGTAVGCGAIREFEPGVMEVKRMYVLPGRRGEGIATIVLSELEQWAKELGNIKTVLETGNRQPEAIALYKKNGYRRIPNFGKYKNVDNSVCFEKIITE